MLGALWVVGGLRLFRRALMARLVSVQALRLSTALACSARFRGVRLGLGVLWGIRGVARWGFSPVHCLPSVAPLALRGSHFLVSGYCAFCDVLAVLAHCRCAGSRGVRPCASSATRPCG